MKEIPYCDTDSKPDFQTRVTSHAFVACNLHERKADTALPPTVNRRVSNASSREIVERATGELLLARRTKKRTLHENQTYLIRSAVWVEREPLHWRAQGRTDKEISVVEISIVTIVRDVEKPYSFDR